MRNLVREWWRRQRAADERIEREAAEIAEALRRFDAAPPAWQHERQHWWARWTR